MEATCHTQHVAGSTKEITMLAIVAAILFALALVLHLADVALGPLDPTAFMLAGLLCLALQFAGVGSRTRSRSRI
jgi:MFS-type transporter involved in bile tolerance (Atg22 family)